MNRRVPIIKLYRTLIVSIQTEVDDDLAEELKDEVAHEARIQDVDALIVEVSGIDVFDSYIAKTVRDLAQICQLLGARTVLVGLDPGMAITLTEMGMEMTGIETALNLEQALELFGGTFGGRDAVSGPDDGSHGAASSTVTLEEDPLTWVLSQAGRKPQGHAG